MHFYLDDFRFEAVWSRPIKSLVGLRQFGVVITPDFSLNRNWPIAAQIWNVYRSRWCGAFWQSQGLTVVPSVSWSYPASYPFAFLGIERGSVVAVSTVGLNRLESQALELFQTGFDEMLQQLRPQTILSYGQLDAKSKSAAAQFGVKMIEYPTRWQGLLRAGRGPRTPEQGGELK